MGTTRIQKAQPTVSDVHVNRPLTTLSVAYIQDQNNFIASRIAPTVPVEMRSDEFFVFDSVDFRRNQAKPRAPGTESAGSGFNITTDSYLCKVFGLHKDVADQTRANQDPGIDLDRSASEFVTQQMLIEKEVSWASAFFTTGVWGTDVVGGTDFAQWDDYAASDPEKDIDDGKLAIQLVTGFRPNTMVVNTQVHKTLKRHPLILDKYKYTSSDSITPTILARYFEVDNYYIGEASYTTSAEGAATEVNAFALGKNAWLGYVAPNPGILIPSAMYTFAWRGFVNSANGFRMKRFYMDHLESWRIEGEWAYVYKRVTQSMGYFLSSVIA